MYIIGLLSLVLIKYINAQNQALTCANVSPNNKESTIMQGCVDDTDDFFLTEFADAFEDRDCLCCTPGNDDNPPDNCVFNQTLSSFEGRVICNENFDCCLCGQIICEDCIDVTCGGDESCLGVNPIKIDGSDTSFAVMNCNGDISCYRTTIYAEKIKAINCNGDRGCGNSTLFVNLDTDISQLTGFFGCVLSFTGDKSALNGFIQAKHINKMECAGDDSCPNSTYVFDCVDSGCPLTVNGDRAALVSTWDIKNAGSLDTNGDDSVSDTHFILDIIESGGPVTITGDRAARGSKWVIKNANSLVANGVDSCANTDWDLDMIPSGGRLVVSGVRAAFRAKWRVRHAKSLTCGGAQGCSESEMDLDFVDGSTESIVVVAGPLAATDATWNFVNPSSIRCSARSACQNVTLNATCQGMETTPPGCDMQCNGVSSCFNSNLFLKNVNRMACAGQNSCSLSLIDAECISTGCPILCNSGCKMGDYKYENSAGLTCIGPINILNEFGVIISREGSCQESNFDLRYNVGGSIQCSGNKACYKSSITDSINDCVTNLGLVLPGIVNVGGISCTGTKSCYDAKIYGECADPIIGCPLDCEGSDACSVSPASTEIIKLNKCNFIKCIGGGTSPACGSRVFEIAPANNENFGSQCSGCHSATFNFFSDFITGPSIIVKDMLCSDIGGCKSAQFNFFGSTEIQGKFSCTATQSCENTTLLINIDDINDVICVASIECLAVDACKNFKLILTLDGTQLTPTQIDEKIDDGTLKLDIKCALAQNCPGATMNGNSGSFNQAFNSIFGDVAQPKLVNSLSIMWIIIVSILSIIIILLVRKNFKYRNIEKQLSQTIKSKNDNNSQKKLKKHSSNKNDRRNKKIKSNAVPQEPNDQKNDDEIQINYNDNTIETVSYL
mmetsp:Transcript_53928/g.66096  ORF Transcript_53928/g.66096 Transcript_53928/m.66096 type:complete len:898 (-) Transcript_53928:214-2907(-)